MSNQIISILQEVIDKVEAGEWQVSNLEVDLEVEELPGKSHFAENAPTGERTITLHIEDLEQKEKFKEQMNRDPLKH